MGESITELQGHIEKITFFNEENGFTIARMTVPGRRDLVTIVGNLIAPVTGQFIKASGEWTRHPKFGEQFKISQCESSLPYTIDGIEKYLSSGLMKGIGPVMAAKIIQKFDAAALDVIEKTPDRLLEIEGIGKSKLRGIKKAWSEQKEIRTLILFLHSHGVGSGYAVRIFKQYGQNAVNILKSNPYRLAAEITGIGFLTADRIAGRLGFEQNSRFRIEAGIIYTLSRLAESGHVYYPYETLAQACREMLHTEEHLIEAGIKAAAADGRIVIDERIPQKGVYPIALYEAEVEIAERMVMLRKTAGSARKIDPQRALSWAQQKLTIRLADKQIDAVRCALAEKIMVITGGPGTGKTTIIKVILEIFRRGGAEISLAAPTGRAAKRMTEATGQVATTIHRLLEFSHAEGGFQRNADNPLNCDLLIVDETSMIDTILMKHLLAALPDDSGLILVGDIHQLPSVGPGNVLRDLIESGVVPVIELEEIFRQARQSDIIMNAHRILNGTMPMFSSTRKSSEYPVESKDFYFIERNDEEEVLHTILELIQKRIPTRFGFNPVDDIQLITPMNKGKLGTIHLNQELQKTLNPSGSQEINRGDRTFRVRDKIMQIRNNYDKDVFNGDIGRITHIDRENRQLTATFYEKIVTYAFDDLDEIAHAYAVSVHKAQGSEYPAVIIPILTSHYIMLQRNLIYTAVTRGKELVILIGSKKALAVGVKNERTHERFTFLKHRLISP